ncbi:MAG: hypothetical protein ACREHD_30210, partial [Pirellulales bacterium]
MDAGKRLLSRGDSIVAAIIALQVCARLNSAEPERPVPPRPKEFSTTGKMRLRVVNAGGKALPGAAIHVSVWTDEDFDHNTDYFTDTAGNIEMKLPKTLTILRIWASSDGCVPLFAGWGTLHLEDGSPIPEEFT